MELVFTSRFLELASLLTYCGPNSRTFFDHDITNVCENVASGRSTQWLVPLLLLFADLRF